MDNRIVDLHVHSSASDGTFSPAELIEEAKKCNLSAMALTDHDTIDGIKEARTAATAANIELIPGIELSCVRDGHEVHIVGLFINDKNEAFCTKLKYFQASRNERNGKMIGNLQREGFSITEKDLKVHFPDCVLTRAHIARYLYDTHQIPDLQVAFSKYIGDNCPCFVPREKISPKDAITLIKSAGGIPILAHPLLYHLSHANLKKLVIELKAEGLVGLEAIYSTYSMGEELEMKQLAKECDLAISGGSDFHGSNKPQIHLGTGRGHLYIPYSVLSKLKEAKCS